MIKMSEEEKTQSFLAKHKPLTQSEVYSKIQISDDRRTKHSKDLEDVEKNLMEFLETEDPIINPATGKAIAWIRHVPYSELMSMVPSDILEVVGDEGEMYKRAMQKQDIIYTYMEKLISRPSWTAAEWKAKATPLFLELFNVSIQEIFSRIEEQVDFF